MLGGRLPETENKRICAISGLKSGRRPLKKFEWWSVTRELELLLFKQYLLRNKTVVYEEVAYGRWSLTRRGRYERVDGIYYILFSVECI